MCTALTYKTDRLYFGRNLDFEHGFGEEIVVTPRNYTLKMRCGEDIKSHYAIIGIAAVCKDYPLYFDAMNEKGLCVAGLNFVGNAVYQNEKIGMKNVAQFEFIPWILSCCTSVGEVRELLKGTNITDTAFSKDMPPSGLHWIAADREECITIESVADGLFVYDNPIGVLTNNPPFPSQMYALNNYINLSSKSSKESAWGDYTIINDSRGTGAVGLPGDLSSRSRFVRAAFYKSFSVSEPEEDVNQVFHILDSVKQIKGGCVTENGDYEYTIYSACCDALSGIYYITTYYDRNIRKFDINSVDLSAEELCILGKV